MRRLLLTSITLLILTCCNLQSQNNEELIRQQIDSLDMIEAPLSQESKSLRARGCAYVIKVRTQEDFDGMEAAICKAIEAGKKDIVVKIRKGVYRFHSNHLMFSNLQQEYVSLTFVGKNAVLTSDESYSPTDYAISPWRELTFADDLVKVMDETERMCFIPYFNYLTEEEKSTLSKVQLTQWYTAPIYEIDHIDSTGIYFVAPDLAKVKISGHSGYNVNYDHLYKSKTPRFRLYDSSLVRPCTASTFLSMKGCTFRTVTLKSLQFRGNQGSGALLSIKSVETQQLKICGCTFDAIRGRVLYAVNTANVVFDGNEVTNTNGPELAFTGGSRRVRVTDNLFCNCGQGLSNTLCVRCTGCDYYIAGNTFRDFGYGAVGVGLWHGHQKKYDTRGIIEHNEMFYTSEYFAHPELHTLMDGGAVYVWTQNDDAIIRYNYIHDFNGMGSNRGIYCDDGASNCKIYGNVVLNIANSYCIDSRAVSDQNESLRNNANNFMADNLVDDKVRFQGNAGEDRHSIKGANIVLLREGERTKDNKLGHLRIAERDIEVSDYTLERGRVVLPEEIRGNRLKDTFIEKIIK